MLNQALLLLILINFGFIGLLPRKFFKQNAKLNKDFWLTAAPLYTCPIFLALAFYDVLPPLVAADSPLGIVMILASVCISTISILLLGMAIGTHRVPLHMFHDQADHRPSHLVTYGPYRHIRHPIYSAYLMALFAAMLFCPQVGTVLCFAYGVAVLTKTAIKEEKKLCQSEELGEEYSGYMKDTGRFLPPLDALRDPEVVARKKSEAAETASNAAQQREPSASTSLSGDR
jgi:protein-S-isoprenylcysteine O-methyltransferase Ste14